MKWIYPFSPFISNTYIPSSMAGKNLMISVNRTAVEVTDYTGRTGYCFDYFNPNTTAFLEDIFSDANFDFAVNGLWLYQNTPYFAKTNLTDKTMPPEIDPFQSIPFWPGDNAKIYAGTLPQYAQSHLRWNGTHMTT